MICYHTCTMCSCNLQGTQVKETGRQLHSGLSFFFKRVQIFARDHSFGISPVSVAWWKKMSKSGPTSSLIPDFYRYINFQKKDTECISPLKRRNGNGVAESELEQADEFKCQFMDVFNKTTKMSTAKSRSQIGRLISWIILLFLL